MHNSKFVRAHGVHLLISTHCVRSDEMSWKIDKVEGWSLSSQKPKIGSYYVDTRVDKANQPKFPYGTQVMAGARGSTSVCHVLYESLGR